jgi:hypothetical protein
MVGFSESPEGRLLLAPPVDSVLFHLGMLRVMPPPSWSIPVVRAAYRRGEPPELIPQIVLGESSYAARVVQT